MARSRGQETLSDAGHDLNGFDEHVLFAAGLINQTSDCAHGAHCVSDGVLTSGKARIVSQGVTYSYLKLIE